MPYDTLTWYIWFSILYTIYYYHTRWISIIITADDIWYLFQMIYGPNHHVLFHYYYHTRWYTILNINYQYQLYQVKYHIWISIMITILYHTRWYLKNYPGNAPCWRAWCRTNPSRFGTQRKRPNVVVRSKGWRWEKNPRTMKEM